MIPGITLSLRNWIRAAIAAACCVVLGSALFWFRSCDDERLDAIVRRNTDSVARGLRRVDTLSARVLVIEQRDTARAVAIASRDSLIAYLEGRRNRPTTRRAPVDLEFEDARAFFDSVGATK